MNRLPFNPETLDERIAGFIAAAQIKVDTHLKRYVTASYAPRPEPLSVSAGGVRWAKIVKPGGVYVFVDRTNGDVRKAKSYSAPDTKGPVRSNVFDEDFGVSGVDHHGAVYLR